VLTIRYRILEPQYVLPGFRVLTVQQDRVGRFVVSDKLEFWIIDDDFALVADSKFAANLQHDFNFVLVCFHVSSTNLEIDLRGLIYRRRLKYVKNVG
jgi:hypothetical protein